MNREAMKLIYL